MKLILYFFLIFSYWYSLSSYGSSLAKFAVITTNEAEKLIRDKRHTFVDVRSLLEYSEGHIPWAIHVPWQNNKLDISKINNLPTPNVIFYCNGLECGSSRKAINFVRQHGCSKKIIWYREGMAGWYKKFLWIRKGIYP